MTATPVAYGLHLNPQGTTARAGQPSTLSVTRDLGSSVIDITGVMPLGRSGRSRGVGVGSGALLPRRASRGTRGGRDRRAGSTRVASRPDVAGATPLLVHESAPLSEVAQRFMKVSQNLYGEVLLRVLSASDRTRRLAGRSARGAAGAHGHDGRADRQRAGPRRVRAVAAGLRDRPRDHHAAARDGPTAAPRRRSARRCLSLAPTARSPAASRTVPAPGGCLPRRARCRTRARCRATSRRRQATSSCSR